jgi:hypothetical protein
VAAVTEAARCCKLGHVVERGVESVVSPQDLEGADSGRIDQQGPVAHLEQFAVGRRVPAARVGFAHGSSSLAVLPEQRVEDRRLADTRRAKDRHGRASRKVRTERVEPVARRCRHGHDRHAGRNRGHGQKGAIEIVGHVALVQDDDRRDAARPGDREIPLDAAQIEVVVEPGDQERDVDVRGHDLLVVEAGAAARAVGSHAPERSPARQNRRDDAALVEGHPVSDDGKVHVRQCLEAEGPGDAGRSVTRGVADHRSVAMDRHDAGRTVAPRRMRRKGRHPAGVPAERAERHVVRHAQPTRFSLPVRFA